MDEHNTTAFLRLMTIMDELREKCPWDKKQTIDTLRPLSIEELYELADAIINKDWDEIKEELGDVMLHLVFYVKIAHEQNKFDMADMLNAVCEKLIYRHPHIYGDVEVKDEEDVKRNWEALKIKNGKISALQGVPKGLPALVKATRIQEKAAKTGFDWPDIGPVFDKVQEELAELKEAVAFGNQHHIDEEMGDVFFSLVNYARFINVDPDTALENCNRKFISRFQKMEALALERNMVFNSLSLAAMDELWNEAKMLERK